MIRASVPDRACAVVVVVLAWSAAAGARPLADVVTLGGSPAAEAIARLAREKRQLDRVSLKIDSRLRDRLAGRTPAAAAPLVPLPAGTATRAYVELTRCDVAALDALRRHGVAVEAVHEGTRRVQARIADADLRAVAALDVVRAIHPVLRPEVETGSVVTEGDAASRADLVRGLGYDGAGVAVGVISDGVSSVAAAQGTGDLGAVDAHCGPGSGNEGTALLEIVHDLAPGAPLLFSGAASSMAFIDAVGCLRAAGARVIVDDLFFPDEPFFEDGPVAQAIAAAVSAGVSYHTSAGNYAQAHLEQPYRASPGDLHDFLGGPVDNTDAVVVPPFGALECVLQWNDPFGGSANDYDLYLVDQTDTVITSSRNIQTGTQDPLEAIAVQNATGFAQVAALMIQKAAGEDRILKLFCFGAGGPPEYVTAAGSIVGHAALPEVVTVAAMNVLDPGLDHVEPFSSQGPSRVFFPALVSRAKPDVTGYDGITISNAGGFPPCANPPCRFFGTSAAAPHSAAVAALLLQENPLLRPGDVLDVLRRSAVDVPPAGDDPVAGAGRLDAFAASGLVAAPGCRSDGECDDGNACNGAETCDPLHGCVPGVPPVCADADPCTTDSCDPAAGCRNVELPGIPYVDCALRLRLAAIVPAASSVAPGRAHRTLAALGARLARAERLVERGGRVSRPRARRDLRAARAVLGEVEAMAERLGPALGFVVADSIRAESDRIRMRIAAVLRTL